MKKPEGATHIDNDGDYWKRENGRWFFYREYFGWCAYVGPVNNSFKYKLREI